MNKRKINEVIGTPQVVPHKFNNKDDDSSNISSTDSTTILTKELLSQSERIPATNISGIDLEALKKKIQRQKINKKTVLGIQKLIKPDMCDNLMRKVVTSSAPDAYKGFTTGALIDPPEIKIKTVARKRKERKTAPTKKSEVTISAWRTNVINARKLLMLEKEQSSEKTKHKTEQARSKELGVHFYDNKSSPEESINKVPLPTSNTMAGQPPPLLTNIFMERFNEETNQESDKENMDTTDFKGFFNPECLVLIDKLKKQSKDIEERTIYWKEEIDKIQSKKPKQLFLGSQMINAELNDNDTAESIPDPADGVRDCEEIETTSKSIFSYKNTEAINHFLQNSRDESKSIKETENIHNRNSLSLVYAKNIKRKVSRTTKAKEPKFKKSDIAAFISKNLVLKTGKKIDTECISKNSSVENVSPRNESNIPTNEAEETNPTKNVRTLDNQMLQTRSKSFPDNIDRQVYFNDGNNHMENIVHIKGAMVTKAPYDLPKNKEKHVNTSINELVLATREKELRKREKRAKMLLKWKRRLDAKETFIKQIEYETGRIGHIKSLLNVGQNSSNEEFPDEFFLFKSHSADEIMGADLDNSDCEIQIQAMQDKLLADENQASKLRKLANKSVNFEERCVGGVQEEVLKNRIHQFDNVVDKIQKQLANLPSKEGKVGVKPKIRHKSKDGSLNSNSRSASDDSIATRNSILSKLVKNNLPVTEDVKKTELRPTQPHNSKSSKKSKLPLSNAITIEKVPDQVHKLAKAFANNKSNCNMLDSIIKTLVDEFIFQLDDKISLTNQFKNDNPNEIEGTAIDKEKLLPDSSTELDDGSLIKVLLGQSGPKDDEKLILPFNEHKKQNRSFDEIIITVSSFGSLLFTSKSLPIETAPVSTCDDEKDFIYGLWALCREITNPWFNKPKRIAHPPQKPWKKSRFTSTSKFITANPRTADELNDVVKDEIKNLFSTNSHYLDGPIYQKMNLKSNKDHVDYLLICELRDEEKLWIEYNEDEHNVLNNLTDVIFDLLINDTVSILKNVEKKRSIFAVS